LSKRHPKVKWIIRLHSETPFIANEGMAFEWIRDYAKHPNVLLSANADRMLKETRFLVAEQRGLNKQQAKDKVVFLPNYYLPEDDNPRHENPDSDTINVGCFGAIRPLKNHMIQAVAALMFAKELDKKLHFHINIGRSEMKGTPILKNLIGMFDGLKEQGHVLHLHQWMPHSEFLEVVKTMDIGLQVSFTETFNIVAADLVACGIPTVVSKEISWMFPYYADPVCSDDIARKLNVTWLLREKLPCANKVLLKDYAENSEKIWVKYFTS
jgi:glycosyltransferase involved in cell wall biosynthesis